MPEEAVHDGKFSSINTQGIRRWGHAPLEHLAGSLSLRPNGGGGAQCGIHAVVLSFYEVSLLSTQQVLTA